MVLQYSKWRAFRYAQYIWFTLPTQKLVSLDPIIMSETEELAEPLPEERICEADILDTIAIHIKTDDAIAADYKLFLHGSEAQKRHSIQELLSDVLHYLKRKEPDSIFSETAFRVAQESAAWYSWRSKCVALLIIAILCETCSLRERIRSFLRSRFYRDILMDTHPEVYNCFYQVVESMRAERECVDWLGALGAVEYRASGAFSQWFSYLRQWISPVSPAPVMETLLSALPDDLSYEESVHTHLYILECVSFAMNGHCVESLRGECGNGSSPHGEESLSLRVGASGLVHWSPLDAEGRFLDRVSLGLRVLRVGLCESESVQSFRSAVEEGLRWEGSEV